ncbi:hypothetical protein K7640_01765 [Micromonospora sp. PLK6-60]|uniref:hypothetical protein n=1 Tax=Micromonospora sp. PLK6-60 TaxID=2873383 RepID=UPI001CA66C8F|nr:hypothetical protein [Micromonospora sp. PLK6-60]MBY8870566.1 hypothetical protein [Micromonospora sp. PLK6-60]
MTPPSSGTSVQAKRTWLRGGLFTLAGLQTIVSVWQYAFPRSFYDDFPTVDLDPPYNEHLVSDVGGLGLALAAVVFLAARSRQPTAVTAALTGYLIYAAAHFLYHVTHFAHFSPEAALGVGTGLGIEVILAISLLYLARLVRHEETGAVNARGSA